MTPDKAFMIGSLPVTNSMITSWIISLAIIIVIRLLVGKTSLIPNKKQLFVESIVGGLRNVVEPIVGNKLFFPSFWLLSGLFIFILIQNWSGLLPGVGSIGYYDESGKFTYLIRPGNADHNITFALATVANLASVS